MDRTRLLWLPWFPEQKVLVQHLCTHQCKWPNLFLKKRYICLDKSPFYSCPFFQTYSRWQKIRRNRLPGPESFGRILQKRQSKIKRYCQSWSADKFAKNSGHRGRHRQFPNFCDSYAYSSGKLQTPNTNNLYFGTLVSVGRLLLSTTLRGCKIS